MVWLIALVCLGVAGASGTLAGPIRGGFSLIGFLCGAILAGPISPLTKKLLPMLGLEHPIWQLFIPQALAFVIVVAVFIIVGSVVHRRVNVHFKYKEDERKLAKWNRLFRSTGLCIGLANGTISFLLLMMPVYIGGYFTTEAGVDGGTPPSAKFVTALRAELHETKLDRVLAAFDPTPPEVYQASDIAGLIMHNPLLKSRLAHYPPFLALGEKPEFQVLANDMQLLEMIDRQATLGEIVRYAPIYNIVTNTATLNDIYDVLGRNLNDLQQYLLTGKSPKYDDETILGIWDVDRQATVDQERKRHPGMNLRALAKLRQEVNAAVQDLTLIATTANQMILRKNSVTIADGSWKKDGDYQVTLPGSKPETTEIEIDNGDTLLLPRGGYVMVFDKEL